MFLLRINMCIITILETKDKLRPAIANHVYRDREFRLVGVHVWNYISDNINIDTPFASFKRILNKFIISEKCMFYFI